MNCVARGLIRAVGGVRLLVLAWAATTAGCQTTGDGCRHCAAPRAAVWPTPGANEAGLPTQPPAAMPPMAMPAEPAAAPRGVEVPPMPASALAAPLPLTVPALPPLATVPALPPAGSAAPAVAPQFPVALGPEPAVAPAGAAAGPQGGSAPPPSGAANAGDGTGPGAASPSTAASAPATSSGRAGDAELQRFEERWQANQETLRTLRALCEAQQRELARLGIDVRDSRSNVARLESLVEAQHAEDIESLTRLSQTLEQLLEEGSPSDQAATE